MVSAPYKTIDERTPTEALIEVVHSAQRMVIARIDLLRLEAKDAARQAGRAAALLGAALVLGLLGWIGLMAAVVVLIALALPLWAALAIVGGAHVIAAIGLGLAGAKSAPKKEDVVVDPAQARARALEQRTTTETRSYGRVQMEGV